VTRPDATKLWRPTEDALTGIVWRDDSQIIRQLVRKRYCGPGEVPGAEVLVDERV
jgi:Holliday junction resolvase RusA-like endonuclease